jgi:hypothetical protein
MPSAMRRTTLDVSCWMANIVPQMLPPASNKERKIFVDTKAGGYSLHIRQRFVKLEKVEGADDARVALKRRVIPSPRVHPRSIRYLDDLHTTNGASVSRKAKRECVTYRLPSQISVHCQNLFHPIKKAVANASLDRVFTTGAKKSPALPRVLRADPGSVSERDDLERLAVLGAEQARGADVVGDRGDVEVGQDQAGSRRTLRARRSADASSSTRNRADRGSTPRRCDQG